jgi:L-asparagine transporter-like permease
MNEEIDFTRAMIGVAAYLALVIVGLVMYVVSRKHED